MKDKKGIQLNQAVGAIIALVLVGVLVIVSIYLFASLSSSMLTPNTAGTAINESVTSSVTAGLNANLSASTRISGNCGTITSVINGTNAANIALGNFTQTGCRVVNASSMVPFGTTLFFNYPYTYSAATAASNASDTTITNFSAYPALVGLVGTIIFLGIVIGVLVASFVFGGSKKA